MILDQKVAETQLGCVVAKVYIFLLVADDNGDIHRRSMGFVAVGQLAHSAHLAPKLISHFADKLIAVVVGVLGAVECSVLVFNEVERIALVNRKRDSAIAEG